MVEAPHPAGRGWDLDGDIEWIAEMLPNDITDLLIPLQRNIDDDDMDGENESSDEEYYGAEETDEEFDLDDDDDDDTNNDDDE